VSYETDVTDLGELTLAQLIEMEIPQGADTDDVYDTILDQLTDFAFNPVGQMLTGPSGRPSYLLRFYAGGKLHLWGANFYITEDEKTLAFTQFYLVEAIT
jgi:hypothetical protein